MADSKNYIPALKYDWLTKVNDPVLQLTMPERKFKTALIDQMNIQPGERVLDFGCGSLTLSMMAAQRNAEAEFHGVDIDEKILSIAKRKLEETNLLVQIKLYDGERLPYADNSFDKVMSSLVFHHLTERQKYETLTEIRRVLKPQGSFHIADFGKPANALQRFGFYAVQILDGFETTNDSVKYMLPMAMSQTGFQNVLEGKIFKSLVGTVRLISGTKESRPIL